MRIHFLARQVQNPDTAVWEPATEAFRNDPVTGNFPCVWIPTSDARAARWCVGYAEVTEDQRAALEASPLIRIILESEETTRLNQFSRRAALDAFCDQVGVTRGTNAETLANLVNRLTGAVRSGSNTGMLRTRIARDFGV